MAQQQSLMNELHAMKEMIEDRFNTMAWLGQAKQNPIQSNLMLKMIRAGYSPALARAVRTGMAMRWRSFIWAKTASRRRSCKRSCTHAASKA